jgi:mannose-6-phosphate isomerase-like protein (cupin superfamily)
MADDRYNTRLDNKYGNLTVIDLPAEIEYHWHKHDHEDECFIVLDGELLIDIEGKGTVTLGRHLGYTIPHGVVHRTRALEKTVILMVEGATVTPTGDGP